MKIEIDGARAGTPAAAGRRRPPSFVSSAGLVACLLALSLFALPASSRPAAGQTLERAQIDDLVGDAVPEAFALYRELLTLPNDAHRPRDLLRLADWLEAAFEARGFTTERLPAGGPPLLLAERRFSGGEGPTVLVYHQADGQPVDPGAWNQESPWTPVLKERAPDGGWREVPWDRIEDGVEEDWRVFARSASDSKGPVAQHLVALDLAERAGVRPDFDVKVIVDFEEELGSPHLPDAVVRFRDRLAADMLLILDGPPHLSGKPTLKFGARGIVTLTLTTYGPRSPVHSGHFGNYAPNPAVRLARLLGSMKDGHGRVVLPGWYDGVGLDEETRRVLEAVPDDEAWIRREYLGVAGVDSVAPTLQEALQYPSLNVRGMRSGWVGDEARTIIPATATAEIDVRLVPESDPDRLVGLIRDHIEDRGYAVLEEAPTETERLRHPKLATLTGSVAYGAFRTDVDSRPGRWLARALERYHGDAPVRLRTSGGSIPIAPFVRTLGVPAVSLPTVNPDNNQHSPDENLRVGNFLDGIAAVLAVLDEPIQPVPP